MSLRQVIVAALFGVALLAVSVARAANPVSERWIVGSRTFERVRVIEVTAATVTIAHADGMAQLDLGTLPAELQQRFGYDPAAAAAAALEAQAQLAATEELKRRALEARRHQAEQEAAARAARERGDSRRGSFDFANVEIRPGVDLRPVFAQHNLYLKDQGPRPACALYALVCAFEYEHARHFGINESFSERFLAWAVQETQPGTPVNDGYHFADILDAVTEYGVARTSLIMALPVTPDLRIHPDETVLADARSRRGFNTNIFRNEDPRLIERIIDSLNRETPVIIGVRWPNWRTIEQQALLRDQKPQDDGGHAVTLIGYRSRGTIDSVDFLFRNSYGVSWGIGGCGWMAQSYLKQNILLAFSLTVPKPEA